MSSAPVPDRDSAPWWDALADHRLVVQECVSCETLRWAPRALCNACGSFEWSWRALSGHAQIVSWTVSHRAFEPDRQVPYVVILASPTEAPNIVMPGNWSGDPAGNDLTVGMSVTVGYVDLETGSSDRAQSTICWHKAPRPT